MNMPSSSSVDTRTFKQRKNFGRKIYFFILFFDLICCVSFKATRKEEVAGIRNKFPNSKLIFLKEKFEIIFDVFLIEIPVIVERYHKEKDLAILGNT